MEYYNGKLCVTYDDLAGIATMNAIQCIVKKDASIQARKACRSNPALFDLDRLPLKFQLEVYRRRPDLKAQAESKPFVESVEPDGAALDFYQRHQPLYLPNLESRSFRLMISCLSSPLK